MGGVRARADPSRAAGEGQGWIRSKQRNPCSALRRPASSVIPLAGCCCCCLEQSWAQRFPHQFRPHSRTRTPRACMPTPHGIGAVPVRLQKRSPRSPAAGDKSIPFVLLVAADCSWNRFGASLQASCCQFVAPSGQSRSDGTQLLLGAALGGRAGGCRAASGSLVLGALPPPARQGHDDATYVGPACCWPVEGLAVCVCLEPGRRRASRSLQEDSGRVDGSVGRRSVAAAFGTRVAGLGSSTPIRSSLLSGPAAPRAELSALPCPAAHFLEQQRSSRVPFFLSRAHETKPAGAGSSSAPPSSSY
jgi:hypothetical protein